MYHELIQTPAQAIVHLFFHCCMKDGQFKEEELKMVSDIIVSIGLNKELDLKGEMQHYQSYYQQLRDESAYLAYLIKRIKPTQKLALFSFCAELFLSDKNITLSEEVLINKIAAQLYIDKAECKTVQELVTQLNEVQKTKLF